jgi:hypothetical protein
MMFVPVKNIEQQGDPGLAFGAIFADQAANEVKLESRIPAPRQAP